MAYHAQFEHWIAAPLDEVFAFFASPRNLPRIMPAWLDVRIEEAAIVPPPDASCANFAGVGSTLLASYRALPFAPFRIHSTARIVGFAMNEFFSDVQDRGPFESWHHRHEFAAETRNGILGTRLRDRIEYEVGPEPLAWVLNALFIAPQMRRTFAYRQCAIERLLVGER
jgi:ligand-binding SRPBCC domain-containing protein